MTVDQWAAVVGFFLPAVVSVFNQEPWKPWLKAVVALGSSVFVGTLTALFSGSFTGANWLTTIGIVFAASQAAYHAWWSKSGITDWIEQSIIVGKKAIAPPPAPPAN